MDAAVTRIADYFAACSSGTSEDVAAHFTSDAVVYDTNFAPVRGAAAIGQFWLAVRRRWHGATWKVDQAHSAGNRAVCEWSMTGRNAEGRAFVFRGSDHYNFAEDGRIAQVRQYWSFDPDRLDTALVDFPYDAREASAS